MKLEVYKTLWGYNGTLSDAIAWCKNHELAGVEGPPPPSAADRCQLLAKLQVAGLNYIAEVCTSGSYIPNRLASPAEHLESLRRQAYVAMECRPRFVSVIAGCDAWELTQSLDFFGEALAFERELGTAMSFETHRSRSLFNPWITRDILNRLPNLKLTCDFSHWCVVCERLINTEPEILGLCAEHAYHVHARVGYDQGPQVPHPAAPEYHDALSAHERWWTQIWESQVRRGMQVSTLTPEFGPDGYLHALPFSRAPVADLDEINHWVALRQKERFQTFVNRVAE